MGCGLDPRFGKDTGLAEGPDVASDGDASDGDEDADGGAGLGPGITDADADADSDVDADADADADSDTDGSGAGGPSTQCPDGSSYYDCGMNCVPSEELGYIGDGFCDDGEAGTPNFNCEEFSYDAGDCTGGSDADSDGTGGGCTAGEVEDCSGVCHLEYMVMLLLGDGSCDEGGLFTPDLNCADWSYDYGDCESSDGGTGSACSGDEVEDCNGVCYAEYLILASIGDGYCDDESDIFPDLDCADWSYDGGDCGSSGGGDGGGGPPAECSGTYLGSAIGEVATGSTTGAASTYSPSCGSSYYEASDVAFFWYPPVTGPYVIDTDGSAFDTVLAVYESDCWTELYCNDDDPDSATTTSALEGHFSSGSSYVIVVDGYGDYSTGTYVLNINPAGVGK